MQDGGEVVGETGEVAAPNLVVQRVDAAGRNGDQQLAFAGLGGRQLDLFENVSRAELVDHKSLHGEFS
ncbi:hypothetical protein D3C84_909840 [compost metagenome]